MKLSKILLLILALALFLPAMAQQPAQPVRWRAVVTAGPDGTGVLTVKALVAKGWHLYALDLPDGGPRPTSFDLSESKDMEFDGTLRPAREAIEVDDPMFGMKLAWWDSNIEFTVPFRLTGPAGSFKCKVSYMACDGTTCRPPSTEVLSGSVKPKEKK